MPPSMEDQVAWISTLRQIDRARTDGPHREMAQRLLIRKWENLFKALVGRSLLVMTQYLLRDRPASLQYVGGVGAGVLVALGSRSSDRSGPMDSPTNTGKSGRNCSTRRMDNHTPRLI